VNHTPHLSAGTAIVEVTPKAGVSLGGYPHHPRYNQGVHDPLYAACLILDDGVTKAAIVNMDVISFSKKHVRAVREEASRRTSIPAGNILISCSHSHSAPRASTNFTMDAMEGLQEPDAEFVDSLNRKLVSLIVEASVAPFPARLGVEKGFCGREQGVGGNRRDPLGLADPEVWTIGVQDLQGAWRAILVKYSLHPTFLHSDNLLVSADYPGYIRKHLASVAPGAVILFSLGTCGNQSPRYFRSGKTFAEAERVGTAIGREAAKVLEKMTLSSQVPLVVKSREIAIDLRVLPDRDRAQAAASKARDEWQAIKAAGAPEPDVWNAELRFLGAEDTLSLVLLKEQGRLAGIEENLPVEVQVIGIGDARIVGLPGEIFAEFGVTIQYRAPFAKVFVVELANGMLPGYAGTTQAYVQGGYETGASMLTGRSGEQMVEAAVQLLCET
jgi:neutral ceramidase